MSKKYYFIGMYQKDMFKNQVLEEILRERKTFYAAKKQEIDFWILLSPNFLNIKRTKEKILETNYYKKLNTKSEQKSTKYLSCIISSNKEFVEWIKLRLGYFENVTLKTEIIDKVNSIYIYESNGICGEVEKTSEHNYAPLDNNNSILDKEILVTKFSKTLDSIIVD